MTEKEAFEMVMGLMGMSAEESIQLTSGTVINYVDKGSSSKGDNFTTCGYDEFRAGILFDDEGSIIKGYIDSHVAYSSPVCDELQYLTE